MESIRAVTLGAASSDHHFIGHEEVVSEEFPSVSDPRRSQTGSFDFDSARKMTRNGDSISATQSNRFCREMQSIPGCTQRLFIFNYYFNRRQSDSLRRRANKRASISHRIVGAKRINGRRISNRMRWKTRVLLRDYFYVFLFRLLLLLLLLDSHSDQNEHRLGSGDECEVE